MHYYYTADGCRRQNRIKCYGEMHLQLLDNSIIPKQTVCISYRNCTLPLPTLPPAPHGTYKYVGSGNCVPQKASAFLIITASINPFVVLYSSSSGRCTLIHIYGINSLSSQRAEPVFSAFYRARSPKADIAMRKKVQWQHQNSQ